MRHIQRFHVRRGLLAFALLLLPAVVSAQERGGPKRGNGPRRMSSVAILIDARDDLKLSSDQLVQLDSLQKVLVERNRPLVLQMQAMRESAGGGRGARRSPRDMTTQEREMMKAGMEAMRPIGEEMRKNDAALRTAAESLLDGNQKLVARDLLAKRQGERRERSGRDRRDHNA